MKKFLKWLAIIICILIAIFTVVVWIFAGKIEKMREHTYTIADSRIPVPNDSASLARGSYWAQAICANCHGTNFSGSDFFDDPKLGTIHAPNLTSGKGGVGGNYTDEDWVRAIRHGVRKGNSGIMIMPAQNFNNLSDIDLACLIAFLKTVPPVDQEWGPPHFTLTTRMIGSMGGFGNLYAANIIDHSKLHGITAPAKGVTVEYGDYLVRVIGCRSCHGKQLNGIQPPDPDSPFSPNISPGGALGKWTDMQFIQTIRTGSTPEGRIMNPKFMPWPGFAKLNDDDLNAIYLYLKSQPEVADAKKK